MKAGMTTKLALAAGLAVGAAAMADLQTAAHAGGFAGTCAQADPGSGGATINAINNDTITAVGGDVITISLGTATLYSIVGPGVNLTMQTGTNVITVQNGQGGTFTISTNPALNTAILSCSVAGAAKGAENQQRTLSSIVVGSQTTATVNQTFDAIGESFAQGSGGGAPATQIASNGFSVNAAGFRSWLNRKERERVEKQIDAMSGDDDTAVHVVPTASHVAGPGTGWNAWLKGSWTHYDGKGSSFDGDTFGVTGGVDYRVSHDVVVGLLLGYGHADFDTVVSGAKGSFDADGVTVGPYVGVKLSEHLRLDAMLAYTYSDYDTKSGAASGDFDADRITGALQLTGHWTHGLWIFEPSAKIVYAEEDQDAYTDSFGVRHGSLDVNAGRVSVGPKIGYGMAMDDGSFVKPWFGVHGEYEFSNQGATPNTGLPDLDDVLSARFSAGVDSRLNNGTRLSVDTHVSGVGTGKYTAYGASARIDVPF